MDSDLRDRVSRCVADVAREYCLDLVVLFGSRVGGPTHARSDLDLAVRSTSGPLDFRRLIDIGAALRELLPGEEVDVVDLGRADPLLLRKIFERAVVIHEEPGAFAAARLRAFHRYQDYRPFLRLERDVVRRALGFDAG